MTGDDFDDSKYPLAYLITLRCFGTWLHGDDREAVDRHGFNLYGTPRRRASPNLQAAMKTNMRVEPILFSEAQREVNEKSDCRSL